ncbi:hypothetical protein CYMTET_51145 [Cymbomonas tetramitiformis]|uniref:Uncharacterized protein n=1 Tax=Cymbomonas tetramitiformis TaxID=36881 RepID=A0AAE0ES47_9CHLO|nr:hypothetical protein CYMTET_51145 [Cymbomonas tetramitiformis]
MGADASPNGPAEAWAPGKPRVRPASNGRRGKCNVNKHWAAKQILPIQANKHKEDDTWRGRLLAFLHSSPVRYGILFLVFVCVCCSFAEQLLKMEEDCVLKCEEAEEPLSAVSQEEEASTTASSPEHEEEYAGCEYERELSEDLEPLEEYIGWITLGCCIIQLSEQILMMLALGAAYLGHILYILDFVVVVVVTATLVTDVGSIGQLVVILRFWKMAEVVWDLFIVTTESNEMLEEGEEEEEGEEGGEKEERKEKNNGREMAKKSKEQPAEKSYSLYEMLVPHETHKAKQKEDTWSGKLLKFMHSPAVRWAIIFLLVLDVFVMGTEMMLVDDETCELECEAEEGEAAEGESAEGEGEASEGEGEASEGEGEASEGEGEASKGEGEASEAGEEAEGSPTGEEGTGENLSGEMEGAESGDEVVEEVLRRMLRRLAEAKLREGCSFKKELSETGELLEEVCHFLTLIILGCMALELLLLIIALGKEFFKNYLYVLDLIVTSIAIVCDAELIEVEVPPSFACWPVLPCPSLPPRVTGAHAVVKPVQSFPVVNNDHARGLLQRLYQRQHQLMNAQSALREQLAGLPADSDPAELALQLAKLHELQGRLIDEREAKVAIQEEKDALEARLAKLNGADANLLLEKENLQADLLRSEEERLQIAQELLDLHEDYLTSKENNEAERQELEQQLLDLQADKLERDIAQEEQEAERGELELRADQAEESDEEQKKAIEDLKKRLEEASTRLQEAEQRKQELEEGWNELTQRMEVAEEKVKNNDRQVAEIKTEMEEQRKVADKAVSDKTMLELKLKEERDKYHKKTEQHARNVGDLERAKNISEADPGSADVLDSEAVPQQLDRLIHDMSEVHATEEKEQHDEVIHWKQKCAEAEAKAKALYKGYRDLRYRVEDRGADLIADLPHEEQLAGALQEDLEARQERETTAHLQEKCLQLERDLAVARVAFSKKPAAPASKEPLDMDRETAMAEVHKLRMELDDLREQRSATPHSKLGALQSENQELRLQLKEVENTDKSRAQLGLELSRAKQELDRIRPLAKKADNMEALRRQVREFTVNTQAELEQERSSLQTRAVQAEEQLEELQLYMNRTTVAYQKEIMRLRNELARHDTAAVPQQPQAQPYQNFEALQRPTRSADEGRKAALESPRQAPDRRYQCLLFDPCTWIYG